VAIDPKTAGGHEDKGLSLNALLFLFHHSLIPRNKREIIALCQLDWSNIWHFHPMKIASPKQDPTIEANSLWEARFEMGDGP